MRKSHWLRLFAGAAALTVSAADAASYKCKDARGNWSEAACTGVAKPPEKAPEFDWGWKPRIGMTMSQVEQMLAQADELRAKHRNDSNYDSRAWLNPWLLRPESINKTHNAAGDDEQWVFRMGTITGYLYFTDGTLTTIQD